MIITPEDVHTVERTINNDINQWIFDVITLTLVGLVILPVGVIVLIILRAIYLDFKRQTIEAKEAWKKIINRKRA